ncbi:hypothetical protein COO16_04070 [Bacillus pseudomycoides]|nr:hypothetical protein COO16_04070 [Bacillus pseudomycoides]
MDLSVSRDPIEILFFNERINEGRSFYIVGYEEVFSVEILESYLKDEMKFKDILTRCKSCERELPYLDEFVPLLEERLEYLKNKQKIIRNEGHHIVMNALLNSKCTSFALYDGDVDKYYLLTLLSIIEWSPYFMSCVGWGRNDTILAIAIDIPFVSSDIEILLPIEETEKLIYDLDKVNELCDQNAKKWIAESKEHYMEKNKEIEQKLNALEWEKANEFSLKEL